MLPFLASLIAAAIAVLISTRLAIRLNVGADHPHGVRKHHARPVPRIGGLGIMLGVWACALLLRHGHNPLLGAMLACALPVFAAGLLEDVTGRVGVGVRLAAAAASALAATVTLGAVVTHLDVRPLDLALTVLPIAWLFTAFAVSGVAHSFNLIDGFNGLSSMVAAFALLAFAWVARAVGDAPLMEMALACAGGCFGFILWNFPMGRVFLGDGGAYVLGFWAAEIGLLLVARHPDVSPWFPLVVLSYPIWETLFTIFRRGSAGESFGTPDARHLHQLLFRRVIRKLHRAGGPNWRNLRNSITSVVLWAFAATAIVPALMYWNDTKSLVATAFAFCAVYNFSYWRLATFRPLRRFFRRSTAGPGSLGQP